MSNSLLKMTDSLKQDVPSGSALMFGTVTKLEPLTIFADNRLSLSGDFLVVGQACRPHKVTISHTHTYKGQTEYETSHTHAIQDTYSGGGSSSPTSHNHGIVNQHTENVHFDQEYITIEIFPKLKVDDIVILFQFGQRFYVAERIEV